MSRALTNAEIADRLLSLAQLLAAQGENPFKVKAYRRAAKTIGSLPDSLDELARADADLTKFAGIGKGIAAAIREIVLSGKSQQLETLRAQVSPEVAAISEYPRLDAARVLRIYKKLKISSVAELKEKLAQGEVAAQMGARMDQHVRQALTESHEMLLYDADAVAAPVKEFLLTRCPVTRVEASGDYRRKVEVLREVAFLIATDDLPAVAEKLKQFGGGAAISSAGEGGVAMKLSSGFLVRVEAAEEKKWGAAWIRATGSSEHLRKLGEWKKARLPFGEEAEVYRKLGLSYIAPELREGRNEVELAVEGKLPVLVTAADIRGELHAHTTSSDGAHTIEQMARAAQEKGYEYTGITDHSRSLKIARGLSEEELWKQIRYIDKWNAKAKGFRILKSAEVDILADGSLDYPDELLKELDYTVCSIHSKFSLDRATQTGRILRAMDNRYFTILGHATGRLLLKRPGYEIDVERVIAHAKKRGCYLEINSSPDRLDLSFQNARMAKEAGVKIAISTDAHSTREFDFIACGIEQARRAGLEKESVLNSLTWPELQKSFRR